MIASILVVALEYAAPASCPDREHFWENVVHAAPDLRLVTAAEAGRRYRVTVQASPSGFRGELAEAGKPAPRLLEAADCAELVEALALMLVLSTEQGPAPAESVPARPAPAEPVLVGPASAEPVTALPPRAQPPDSGGVPDGTPDTKNSEAMLGALIWAGAAPDPLLGITAGLQHSFGPVIIVRIEARAAQGSERVDATYVGLAPQACARAGWSRVVVAACSGAAVGTLQVKGVEYSGPERQSSAWLAATLGTRVSVSLAPPLFMELSAEGEHGFIERAYHLKRANAEWATPAFSALLTLGLGALF